MPAAATIPCLWPGETIVCLGAGPSLRLADVELLRGQARVIAVNDAYRLAPWADVVFAADSKWWRWQQEQGVRDDALPAMQVTLDRLARDYRPSVIQIERKGVTGLWLQPDGVCTGGHGGYAAINLAVHLGAARIVLLGYDMLPATNADGSERHHFFGAHPDGTHPKYPYRIGAYASLLDPLARLNISIVNCTPRTAIRAIPRQSLAAVLQEIPACPHVPSSHPAATSSPLDGS